MGGWGRGESVSGWGWGRGKSQLVGGVGRGQWVSRGGEGSVGEQGKGMVGVENRSRLSK